ncbi:MAG: GtrA family protein [Nitrososphaerota archaeon]|nr:GtrA family protein [Candidatus Calditenuaceae archaeon]MDW8073898.1 GtrA family protein [Nitrososphaerota archaeon]
MASRLLKTINNVVRLGTSKLALKFVLVGIICLLLAEAILYLLVDVWGVNSLVAGAVSIEISVVANFIINDVWTFRESRSSDGFFTRMLKFHITRVASIAVNYGIYSLLVALLGVNHLLAYFVATVVAFSINFLTSVVWVWRGVLSGQQGVPTGRPPSQPSRFRGRCIPAS